jgi:hypothetical protein
VRARGEVFDAAFPLAEALQQFQAMRVTERLGDLREAGEHRLFRTWA